MSLAQKRLAAAHPGTPPAVLGALLGNIDDLVKVLAALNPNTPRRTIISEIAREKFPAEALAYPVDAEILAAAVERKALAYRRAVAQNPGLTEAQAEHLMHDRRPEVRAALAERGMNLTDDQFARLYSDPDTAVRIAAASNFRAPESIITAASIDPDRSVRKAAASSARATMEHLLRAELDSYKTVRLAARFNEIVLGDHDRWVKAGWTIEASVRIAARLPEIFDQASPPGPGGLETFAILSAIEMSPEQAASQ